MNAPRRPKRDVDGWLILDKPVGMTSTHAVSIAKRAFQAKKAGHAGTLDPLASGVLPIALGEATKTVPMVMDGRKAYRFTVRWGIETDTDDAEGRATATSDVRPEPEAVRALLPRFTGEILQVPPRYSAIKIDGERAYDLAREGEEVVLEARPVIIDTLELVASPDRDHAEFEATCGKGTYVRALARDIGRALGSHRPRHRSCAAPRSGHSAPRTRCRSSRCRRCSTPSRRRALPPSPSWCGRWNWR